MRASLSLVRLRWVALASLLPVACSSDTSEEKRTRVNVVMGVGTSCRDRVNAVELTATVPEQKDVSRAYTVKDKSDLPHSERLDLASDGQTPHDLTAEFSVDVTGQSQDTIALGLRLPALTQGRVSINLPCVCLGRVCPPSTRCVELPANTGNTYCEAENTCGDGVCGATEAADWCPADCAASCGDGVCQPGESCSSCATDCGSCCGDGKCNAAETCASCPGDCGVCAGEACGDGKCTGSETRCTCAQDCGKPACHECGGTCQGPGGSGGQGGAAGMSGGSGQGGGAQGGAGQGGGGAGPGGAGVGGGGQGGGGQGGGSSGPLEACTKSVSSGLFKGTTLGQTGSVPALSDSMVQPCGAMATGYMFLARQYKAQADGVLSAQIEQASFQGVVHVRGECDEPTKALSCTGGSTSPLATYSIKSGETVWVLIGSESKSASGQKYKLTVKLL